MSNKLSERVFVDPGLLKMNDALGKFDVGTLTAFRPEFTYGQNRDRNKQLLAFFLNKRYTIALIKGSYIEDMKSANSVVVTEESFFISDERKLGVLLTELKKFLISSMTQC